MFSSGYYNQPSKRSGPGYIPAGMTAFLSGDTVATGTYAGDQYPPLYSAPSEEELAIELLGTKGSKREEQAVEVATEPTVELTTLEELEVTTLKPKRLAKKKKPQVVAPAEETEDEPEEAGGSWPFQNGRIPAYNTFFPIVIGGYPSSRSRNADSEVGGYPGAATAIANSFSTGKGGVASSHATAFGDPTLSALFRNGYFNTKKQNSKED